MFFLREPSPRDVERFLADSETCPMSYCGRTDAAPPRGFRVDRHTIELGRGREIFRRAVEALREWRQFDLDWVRLVPFGSPVAPGTVVAVRIRHLGFWSLNGCRVVALSGSEEANAFLVMYRTLENHAECGEESFVVTLDPDTAVVSYAIHAVSKPRAPLAVLGTPVVRHLQARFRRDSAEAMRRAVA